LPTGREIEVLIAQNVEPLKYLRYIQGFFFYQEDGKKYTAKLKGALATANAAQGIPEMIEKVAWK
jgi:hypothetical protein